MGFALDREIPERFLLEGSAILDGEPTVAELKAAGLLELLEYVPDSTRVGNDHDARLELPDASDPTRARLVVDGPNWPADFVRAIGKASFARAPGFEDVLLVLDFDAKTTNYESGPYYAVLEGDGPSAQLVDFIVWNKRSDSTATHLPEHVVTSWRWPNRA